MQSKNAELGPGSPQVAVYSGEVAYGGHKWREDPRRCGMETSSVGVPQAKPFYSKFQSDFIALERNRFPDLPIPKKS